MWYWTSRCVLPHNRCHWKALSYGSLTYAGGCFAGGLMTHVVSQERCPLSVCLASLPPPLSPRPVLFHDLFHSYMLQDRRWSSTLIFRCTYICFCPTFRLSSACRLYAATAWTLVCAFNSLFMGLERDGDAEPRRA